MTLEMLRRKRSDGSPVFWPGFGCYGQVMRIARDGSWADMEWATDMWALIQHRRWRKRQPLDRLSEWVHG